MKSSPWRLGNPADRVPRRCPKMDGHLSFGGQPPGGHLAEQSLPGDCPGWLGDGEADHENPLWQESSRPCQQGSARARHAGAVPMSEERLPLHHAVPVEDGRAHERVVAGGPDERLLTTGDPDMPKMLDRNEMEREAPSITSLVGLTLALRLVMAAAGAATATRVVGRRERRVGVMGLDEYAVEWLIRARLREARATAAARALSASAHLPLRRRARVVVGLALIRAGHWVAGQIPLGDDLVVEQGATGLKGFLRFRR